MKKILLTLALCTSCATVHDFASVSADLALFGGSLAELERKLMDAEATDLEIAESMAEVVGSVDQLSETTTGKSFLSDLSDEEAAAAGAALVGLSTVLTSIYRDRRRKQRGEPTGSVPSNPK